MIWDIAVAFVFVDKHSGMQDKVSLSYYSRDRQSVHPFKSNITIAIVP